MPKDSKGATLTGNREERIQRQRERYERACKAAVEEKARSEKRLELIGRFLDDLLEVPHVHVITDTRVVRNSARVGNERLVINPTYITAETRIAFPHSMLSLDNLLAVKEIAKRHGVELVHARHESQKTSRISFYVVTDEDGEDIGLDEF